MRKVLVLLLLWLGGCQSEAMDAYDHSVELSKEGHVMDAACEYNRAIGMIVRDLTLAKQENRTPSPLELQKLSPSHLKEAIRKPENFEQTMMALNCCTSFAPEVSKIILEEAAKMLGVKADIVTIVMYYSANKSRLKWDESKHQFVIGTQKVSNGVPEGCRAIAESGLAEDGCPKKILCLKDGSQMMHVTGGRVFNPGFSDYNYGDVRHFYMDRYPVTVEQYLRFCKETGRPKPAFIGGRGWDDVHYDGLDDPKQPMTCVTWHDAMAYAKWAGKSLPTDREYIRAAFGDSKGPAPWGKFLPIRRGSPTEAEPQGPLLNREELDQYAILERPRVEKGGRPAKVGGRSKGASSFGIEDLLGNVKQWEADASHSAPNWHIIFGWPFYFDWIYSEEFNLSLGGEYANLKHPWLGFRCVIALP